MSVKPSLFFSEPRAFTRMLVTGNSFSIKRLLTSKALLNESLLASLLPWLAFLDAYDFIVNTFCLFRLLDISIILITSSCLSFIWFGL